MFSFVSWRSFLQIAYKSVQRERFAWTWLYSVILLGDLLLNSGNLSWITISNEGRVLPMGFAASHWRSLFQVQHPLPWSLQNHANSSSSHVPQAENDDLHLISRLHNVSFLPHSWETFHSLARLHAQPFPNSCCSCLAWPSPFSLRLPFHQEQWNLLSLTVFITRGFQISHWLHLLTPCEATVETPLTYWMRFRHQSATSRLQHICRWS